MSYKLSRDSTPSSILLFTLIKRRSREDEEEGKREQSAPQQPSLVHAGIVAKKKDEGV